MCMMGVGAMCKDGCAYVIKEKGVYSNIYESVTSILQNIILYPQI